MLYLPLQFKPVINRFKKISALSLILCAFAIITFRVFLFINIGLATSILLSTVLTTIIGLIALHMVCPGFDLTPDISLKQKERLVSLTFDDGPTPGFTDKILSILKENSVCGTFFVLGEKASLYPSIIEDTIVQGHEIGIHAYKHKKLNWSGLKEFDFQIAETDKIVEQICMKTDVSNNYKKIFRPPNGRKNIFLKRYLKKHGYALIPWTREVWDYISPGAVTIIENATKKTASNEIILLHDGLNDSLDVSEAQKTGLLDALPQIIENYKNKGYKFVKASYFLRKNSKHLCS